MSCPLYHHRSWLLLSRVSFSFVFCSSSDFFLFYAGEKNDEEKSRRKTRQREREKEKERKKSSVIKRNWTWNNTELTRESKEKGQIAYALACLSLLSPLPPPPPSSSSTSPLAMTCQTVVYDLLFYFSTARCNKHRGKNNDKIEAVLNDEQNQQRRRKKGASASEHKAKRNITTWSS